MPRKPKEAAGEPKGKKQARSAAPKPKAPRGRPCGYKGEFAEQARMLCQKGWTDYEMAQFFGIHVATLYRWQAKYPEFCDALKLGKEVADSRVVRSLYHKANGYTYEAEEVFQFQGKIIRAKVTKHVPPSDTAIFFWLQNRDKENWRNVQKHEHGGVGAFDAMTDDELAAIARRAGRTGSTGAAQAPRHSSQLN